MNEEQLKRRGKRMKATIRLANVIVSMIRSKAADSESVENLIDAIDQFASLVETPTSLQDAKQT